MSEIVNEAKILNVDVYPPDIRDLESNFYITAPTTIKFGIGNVKGIGPANVKKIRAAIAAAEENFKPFREWSWYEFLCLMGPKLSASAVVPLISVGAFKHWKISRKSLLEEYTQFKTLFKTAKAELAWTETNWFAYNNFSLLLDGLAIHLEEGLKDLKKSGTKTETKLKNRISTIESVSYLLKNPASSMEDNPNDIAVSEEFLMGIALTCSRADGKIGEQSNITCKEFLDGRTSPYMIFKVQIDEIHEYKIPAGKGKEENIGKTMAFLKVSDGTCKLENIVIYPDLYEGSEASEDEGVEAFEGYRNILLPGSILGDPM